MTGLQDDDDDEPLKFANNWPASHLFDETKLAWFGCVASNLDTERLTKTFHFLRHSSPNPKYQCGNKTLREKI
jgi:hypothetical protein